MCNQETKSAKLDKLNKQQAQVLRDGNESGVKTQLEHFLRGRRWQEMSLPTQEGTRSHGNTEPTVKNPDAHLRKGTQHF